jgi:hypothetical protein
VSRAINAYTYELATLIEQGRRVLSRPEAQEREDALLAISEKLGTLVTDVSVEISGAHMFTRNQALHDALDEVNAAMMRGPQAEMKFRHTVITLGVMPQPRDILTRFLNTLRSPASVSSGTNRRRAMAKHVIGIYSQGAMTGQVLQDTVAETQSAIAQDVDALSAEGLSSDEVRDFRIEVAEESGMDVEDVRLIIDWSSDALAKGLAFEVARQSALKIWRMVVDRIKTNHGSDAIGDEISGSLEDESSPDKAT